MVYLLCFERKGKYAFDGALRDATQSLSHGHTFSGLPLPPRRRLFSLIHRELIPHQSFSGRARRVPFGSRLF